MVFCRIENTFVEQMIYYAIEGCEAVSKTVVFAVVFVADER